MSPSRQDVTAPFTSVDVSYSPTSGQEPRPYRFSWRANPAPKSSNVYSVDWVVTPLPVDDGVQQHALAFEWPSNLRSGFNLEEATFDIRTFLDPIVQSRGSASAPTAIKLILPKVSGYVAQSNIIQTRFHSCPQVESVANFLQPGGYVEAFTAPVFEETASISQLYDIVAAAVGAVCSTVTDTEASWEALDRLEYEVRNRLGLQFLMPEPVPRKRIGIVQCLDYRMSLELMRHLNIDLVVFDEPGTCTEDPNGPRGHLRVSFHTVDLTPNDSLVERLYLAAQNLRLDGLTSRFDPIFRQVAQVAELLKLPTPTVTALSIATNKYLTRMNQPEGEPDQVICVTSRQELEDRLNDPVQPLQVPYPVVVKPTKGWGSYGVAKAVNEAELLVAAEWAAGHIIGFVDSKVMIEPYCDGPEVDINLAMWDGEVTFFDVSDNAPTAGDLDEVTSTGRKDFQEGLFMYPSQIPESEQSMVCRYIHQCILNMGFRTGVFHCEARIKNSCMHYVRHRGSPIIDLEPKSSTSDTADAPPGVLLIEINARAPGYVGLYASSWTYGVDMWTLHVLNCLGDEARFRALSVAFADGPQHDTAVLLIMPHKSGILTSEDPLPRLKVENPGLAACVPLCLNYFKKGQEVTPPDVTENCFTSVLLVEEKGGRGELMRTVEEVRRVWTPVIE